MKPIKINKDKIYYRIGFRTFIYERTIEEFMEFNPPCKECLVQAVCVNYAHPLCVEYKDAAHEEFLLITIRGCEDLNKFIRQNPVFFMYNDEPIRRREKKKMNRKISELSEKFIVYYSMNNSVDIYTTLEIRSTKLTMNEFMKYNPPCKECLVQSMCINGQDNIEHIIINGGITMKSCEKLKSFIKRNRPLFYRVKLKNF